MIYCQYESSSIGVKLVDTNFDNLFLESLFNLVSHRTVLLKVSLLLCFGKGGHVLKRAVAQRGRQPQVLLHTFFYKKKSRGRRVGKKKETMRRAVIC